MSPAGERGVPSLESKDSGSSSPTVKSGVDPKDVVSCKVAVFLTVNSAVGAGLVNMPFAFQSAGGLLMASIIHLLVFVFIVTAIFILSFCCQMSRAHSFHQLVQHFCGRRASQLTGFCIVLYTYGTCVTLIVMIGDQMERLMASVYGDDFCSQWFLTRSFSMTWVSVCLILPLSLPKSLNFLKYSSWFGVCVLVYIIFLTIYAWMQMTVTTETVDDVAGGSKHMSMSQLLSAIVFGYQCHLEWVPTYAGMRESCSSPRHNLTVIVSFTICLIVYQTVAVFGLMTFGPLLRPDLMLNYDASNPLVMIAVLSLALKSVTNYPLILFPARIAIEDAVCHILGVAQASRQATDTKRRVFIVTVWFMTTLLLALLVPDIAWTIRVMGSLAVVFALVMPGVCLISAADMMRDSFATRQLILMNAAGAAVLLLGVFVFGLTITDIVFSSATNYSHPLCILLRVDRP